MCFFKKNIIKQIILDNDSTKYHIGVEVYASRTNGLFETTSPLKIFGRFIFYLYICKRKQIQ